MILFQVIDLAAKSCGEPHVAPSWEIAKASLGSLLAKTPELAERAHALRIEYIGEFDPETGYTPFELTTWDKKVSSGDVCLAEFLAACRKEEDEVQRRADMLSDDEKQEFFEEACKRQNEEDAKNVIRFREGLKQSEVSVDG